MWFPIMVIATLKLLTRKYVRITILVATQFGGGIAELQGHNGDLLELPGQFLRLGNFGIKDGKILGNDIAKWILDTLTRITFPAPNEVKFFFLS